jgi:hypothetical protein
VCDYIFEKPLHLPGLSVFGEAGMWLGMKRDEIEHEIFGLVMWVFIIYIAYEIYNLWPSKERKTEDEIMKVLKGRVLSHNQLFRMVFMAHTVSFEDFGKAMDRLETKGKVSRLLSADMTPMWIPVDKN